MRCRDGDSFACRQRTNLVPGYRGINRSKPVTDTAFEDFWKAYPRKVGKLAALREWQLLKPTPEMVRQMADALAWLREQWTDPQYIPHPRTWLHQGRWMDEKPEPVKPKLPASVTGMAAWVQRVVHE